MYLLLSISLLWTPYWEELWRSYHTQSRLMDGYSVYSEFLKPGMHWNWVRKRQQTCK